MTISPHSSRWQPYLKAGVAVYVFAAMASALLIGIAAEIRDQTHQSDPLSFLGLALLAALPLLIIGIPMSIALCAVLHWVGQDHRNSWPIAVLAVLCAGLLLLLILVNFHLELISTEAMVYVLPWLLFGAAYGLAVAQPSRDVARR